MTFVGLRTGSRPSVAEFTYDIMTMTATWRFEDLVANDQYAIMLSDAVTDVEGDRLDGEWTNPASVSTVNSAVSEFPSGDGEAGGKFVFVMTLLAGDANRNGVVEVNGDDYLIWQITYENPGVFPDGDFSGDGFVDDDDLDLMMANEDLALTTIEILADLNGDDVVDFDDLDIMFDNRYLANPAQADGDLDQDGDIDLADVDLAFAQMGLAIAMVS
jgi:hypothetical protein